MSLTDTANAKKYASIAETAAAQAKISADKLESAPDYAEQAASSAAAAATSASSAVAAESVVNNLAISASESATSAAASAAEAGDAAAAAIGQCLRVPDGEFIDVLPPAASRENTFLAFDSTGNVSPLAKDDVAILDSEGKVPVSMIPAIAISEVFVVGSQEEMLALNAQTGDVAKRTDLGFSFTLAAEPASTLSNWVQLNDDVLAQLGLSSGATEIGALDDDDNSTTVQGALNLKVSITALASAIAGVLSDLASTAINKGAYLLGFRQPLTGAVARTAQDKFEETVTVADFGPVGNGNATEDMAAINAALNSGATRINFGNLHVKVSGWFIIPNPDMVLISDNATFEQELWGYPVFEIRTPRVKMLGHWNFEYNGDRSVVISSNTLGYPFVTEGDWKAYGSAIWMNYYESRDISGFHIDSINVYGFIAGIWFTGANASINQAYFDTIDFGVFGVIFDNQIIGSVYHKNITASQTHEGHAVYCNGTGAGFAVQSIYVKGSPLGCSPLKLHTTKGFYVGSISGTGLGAIAYFRTGASGFVGSINCICDQNVAFTGPDQGAVNYNILVIDVGTDVRIGTVDIVANQSQSVYNTALQCSNAGAKLTVDNLRIYNTNSSPAQPSVALCSANGSMTIGTVEVSHPNSLSTSYMFSLLSYTYFNILTPPKVTVAAGAEVFLLRNVYASTNNYQLAYDPAIIYPGVGSNAIICTQNTYWGVLFRGTGNSFNTITGSTPIITQTSQATISQTAATDLTRLRYMSPGQRFVLYNTGGNTNISHNRFPGVDGNIITLTAADINRANWKFATFAKIGSDVYLISYQ